MNNKKIFFESKNYRELVGDHITTRHKLTLKVALRYFIASHVNSILDIGCANGSFSVLLGKEINAKEIYGIDISEANVNEAIIRGCKALVLDIESGCIPFDDASFDLIYVGDVIEHLYNPDNVLKEVHRLLTENGICIITMPNLAALANRIALLFGYEPFPLGTSLEYDFGKICVSNHLLFGSHIRLFTNRAFSKLCEMHNLKTIKTVGMPMPEGNTSKTISIFRTIECFLFSKTLYKIIPSFAWDSLFVIRKTK